MLNFGKLRHLLRVLPLDATTVLPIISHVFQDNLIILGSILGLFVLLLVNLKLLKLFIHLFSVYLLNVKQCVLIVGSLLLQCLQLHFV